MKRSNCDISTLIKNARHVLVIKLRYIGDSIWMLPFVENLKLNLPNAKLSVIVNKGTEPFFYTSPAVDTVIPFHRREIKGKSLGMIKFLSFIKDIRKSKPDVVIELTDGDRAAIITFLSGARLRIGYNNENHWRRHFYTHTVSTRINTKHMVEYHLDVLRELGMRIYDDSIKIRIPKTAYTSLRKTIPPDFFTNKKKKVIIHPGARNLLRQWGAEKFAYLGDTLSEEYRVFLVAGPNEEEVLHEVKRFMKTKPYFCSTVLSLYELAALCESSDLFIGNDSGPIHIASAKTFTIGIYGPTLSKLAGPWTHRKLTFEDNSFQCRPCMQDKCHYPSFKACLEAIRPEDVLSKIKEMSNAGLC
jgi:heptosyltransferase-3